MIDQLHFHRQACAIFILVLVNLLAPAQPHAAASGEKAVTPQASDLTYPTNAAGQPVTSGLIRQDATYQYEASLPPAPPTEPHFIAQAVPPVGDGLLVSYRSFDGSNYLVRQFLGKYTAVLLTPSQVDAFGVAQARELLDTADLYYAAYVEFYGLQPNGSGLLRIAFVKTCGAGCGYVGSRGVEIDPGYVNEPSDTVAEILGVLGHEMNHNFDRFSSYIFIAPDIAHAWNDVVDTYVRLVDRSGSRTRPPEENVRNAVDTWLRPYLELPGSSWETCILNAACTGVNAQHAQGGMVLRLAQLVGVPATQQSLRKLREFVTTRGLSGSSMTATQKADLILESFSHGAGTNLSCYYDAMRWPASSTLRAQLTAAFGSANSLCADNDGDTFSVIDGDLDNSNPNVFPGAVEVLNGIDDDCNYIVDDVLYTEAADFPGSAASAFALPLPARVRGTITTGDGDFFYLNLAAQTTVKFSLRSVDNTFRGWLFLFDQTGGWHTYFYVGAGSKGDMTVTLDPGRWNFAVQLNSVSTPGQYEVIVEAGQVWPVLVSPPAPLNIAPNLWRLTSPPVPAELSNASNLLARFWVSGCGWVATNPAPTSGSVSYDWTVPADVDISQANYRVQFYDGIFAAERVTQAMPFISNAPPTVVLTSPTNATSFQAGGNITVSADVTDPEGALRWVSLYMDDTLLVTITNAPFTFTVSNVAVGTYVFKAVAIDLPGATVISETARVIVSHDLILIPPGATWDYLDTGVPQSTSWQSVTFDDASWQSGAAQLGYGDDDEATVVSFGPNSSSKYITTYFRHAFYLDNPLAVTNLTVSLLRDDGGVVYLNGTEIFRDNMPTGAISFSTRAASNATEGDESTNFHSIGVNPGLLRTGTNVVAVEIHQESTGSSDLSFDLMLVVPATNQPPLVAITAPADGAVLVSPVTFTLNATASDSDGVITKLELFRDSIKLGERTTSPYTTTQSGLANGTYTFAARATDRNGVVVTSAPVTIFLVSGTAANYIPAGARWKYLDDGSNQGTAWRESAFNDAAWPEASSQFGYGDGGETTVVRSNRLDGTRIITTYFRCPFVVDDPSLARGLTARLLRDDGAVVYLNGTEIWRDGMPTNTTITYTTPASITVNAPEESAFFTNSVDHTLLRAGTNVIAVEIHQVNNTSSDISFDFSLQGVRVTPTPVSMNVSIQPNFATISWPAPAIGLRLYSTTNLTADTQWTLVPDPALLLGRDYIITLPATNTVNRFYRLAYP